MLKGILRSFLETHIGRSSRVLEAKALPLGCLFGALGVRRCGEWIWEMGHNESGDDPDQYADEK